MNTLLMCVANSARSQMAEGLARKIFGPTVRIQSAGSEPKHVHPYAARAMREIGIDISAHYAKSVRQLPPEFLATVEVIITLCAEEVCPVVIAPHAQRIHWPLHDPAEGSPEEAAALQRFRQTRDQLKQRLMQFANQSFAVSSRLPSATPPRRAQTELGR